jgi:5-methylthioadenosine/S-adenosylhomocysteine deaminase
VNDSLKIILGGFVVTGDPSRRAGALAVLVRNDRISEVSARGDALRLMYPQAEVIDASGKAILPGFVDAHFHGESILLRHVTSNVPMARWARDTGLRKPFERVYASFTQDQLRRLYEIAYFTSLKAGVTSTAEFGFNRLDLPLSACIDALRRTELRGVLGVHNGDQIEIARRSRHPMLRFALVLPEEDALTTYSLQTTLRLAKEERWPVILSYGESRRAFEALKKNFSRSIVQLAEEYRLFDHTIQFHHLAHYEPGDLELLAKAQVPVIISPMSLLAKGTEAPPLIELLRLQIPIAFGTDWGLPDPLGNVQALMRIASAQGISNIPADALLNMMTLHPSRALGMETETGSIEAGKFADLSFLAISDLRIGLLSAQRNSEDVLREILTYASVDRITDLMVNGEFAVRSGHLLTCSEEELVADAELLLGSMADFPGHIEDATRSAAPQQALADVSPVIDLPGDEGYRVVRTGEPEDPAPAKVLPLRQKRANGPELPKNVRRVFGDDDPV